jgi:hypothetical protein
MEIQFNDIKIQVSFMEDDDGIIKIDEDSIREEFEKKLKDVIDEAEEYNEELKKDKTLCHLCGSEEVNGGWCSNESCAEYKRYKK